LLGVFAGQLAGAIENARLYEQTKRDAEVKAALLRELSHRVKNNLAAITSLLYMALDEPAETREQILNETLGRVQSMSSAHTLLARSPVARVNVLELGRQILSDTVHHLGHPGIHIDINVAGSAVHVAARQTTTLALVLNELATNALRHGFHATPLTDIPTLRLDLFKNDSDVNLQLANNGGGLPPSWDAGLGLNLVRTLVEKDLHGHFTLKQRDQWTCAEIHFRLEEDVL
jgi:two-component sensor histidine kinase